MASGGGTNLQTVIDLAAAGPPPLAVAAVVVNRTDAVAAERAQRSGVPVTHVVWDRARESREAYDMRVLDAVDQSAPDLVLLLGWMHLLAPAFISRFANIVNIHPAYLPVDPEADVVEMPDGTAIPAFRGAHAIRDALGAGVRWYGATVHTVTDRVDRGTIIARTAALLNPAWTENEALAALRPIERETLTTALDRMTQGPNRESYW